jgi:hypothetical protein
MAMVLNLWRVWHFGPDTRFYLAWAYKFGGLSEMDAGKRTYDFLNGFGWFQPYCYGGCDTSDPTITYSWLYRGSEGGLFAQRILYPLLSAPFVRLFGPYGMLVVPAIAFTAAVVLTMVLASRFVGRQWVVLAGLGLLLPINVASYGLYAYTEALAMALLVACVLALPVGRATQPTRRHWIAYAVLLVLFAFTRQFHYVVVLGVVLVWLRASIRGRSLRNVWTPFALISVAVTVVVGVLQRLMSPGYALLRPFLQISGAGTVSRVPAVLPHVLSGIAKGEVLVGGHDFGIVLVAVFGVIGIVVARRSELALLTVGVLVGTLALETVTALPSQNRYWVLSFPLLAVLGAGVVERVMTTRLGPGRHRPASSAPAADQDDGWPRGGNDQARPTRDGMASASI